MINKKLTTQQIDAILPQTQCGLCTYKACLPYAEAIVEKDEKIDRCLPGGITTLIKLAQLTQQNPEPYLAEMQQKTKPPSRAVIREAECIGCTKCIQACPVDAIIGAGKQMHTVIADQCTGCELCIAPCPVDCIDMIVLPALDENTQQLKAAQAKQRYEFRNDRLKKNAIKKQEKFQQLKILQRQKEIQAAVARVKNKKEIL